MIGITPIVSGLTPAAGGRLSKERTEKLSADLAGLRAARQRAWTELRSAALPTQEDNR